MFRSQNRTLTKIVTMKESDHLKFGVLRANVIGNLKMELCPTNETSAKGV